MDADALRELFEPFAAVSVRRMFSGYGVYAEGLCFALNLRGELYLKADRASEARFAAADSEPFIYEGRRGKVTVMSYWRLPPTAYDDPDELRAWCALAIEAARRAFEIKKVKKVAGAGAKGGGGAAAKPRRAAAGRKAPDKAGGRPKGRAP
jgi:DNA transformation protein and related proteins